MLRGVRASGEEQRLYPRLGLALRTAHLCKRALGHMRRMDFSITPGWIGYWCWRVGLVDLWWKRLTPRPPKPAIPEKYAAKMSPPVDLPVLRELPTEADTPTRSRTVPTS
jgi:hypothetical protein